MYLAEQIQNKWAPVLDHAALGPIADQHRRSVTAVVLENTEKALRESAAHGAYQTLTESPTNSMGASSSTASEDCDICDVQSETSKGDKNKTRKKREELSVSATKSIKKEKVEIVVSFE